MLQLAHATPRSAQVCNSSFQEGDSRGYDGVCQCRRFGSEIAAAGAAVSALKRFLLGASLPWTMCWRSLCQLAQAASLCATGKHRSHNKNGGRAFPQLTARYDSFSEVVTKSLPTMYNQAQSSQDPEGGISSTKVVLQPSTIQPGPRTRHFRY